MSAAEDRDCFWPSPALSLELVEHIEECLEFLKTLRNTSLRREIRDTISRHIVDLERIIQMCRVAKVDSGIIRALDRFAIERNEIGFSGVVEEALMEYITKRNRIKRA